MKSHIYPLLASRRRMLGMSQQELAARAGLRREKISRLESKHEDIGLDDLCRLLDAVGLELSVSEKQAAPSAKPKRSQDLVAGDLEKAAFIDGAKAKIVDWGKVPK